ncbi:hypothetical protein LINPERPRIM_LOCUS36282 [Linum perenne]
MLMILLQRKASL